jgi:integrase
MRKRKQQRGSLYRERGFWYIRYYDDRVIDGQLHRKRIAKKITSANGINLKKAREIADQELSQIIKPQLSPETALNLVDFVEKVYFPRVDQRLRPSTLRGYRGIWKDQLKPYCKDLWLRDVRTKHIQDLLDAIGRRGNLNINSLKHAKSFLSGVFRLALQLDFYAGINPAQQTSLPKARPASETYAYSLEEIDAMLSVLPEPAATVIAMAAYTGARRGELRGMLWENYRAAEILISQSVWQKHVTDPKSRKSRAPIPIITRLAHRLEFHRTRVGNPDCGPIFRNQSGKPMDLNNLLNRTILPVLNRCVVCKAEESTHSKADHVFQRDTLPEWKGWHAFRRGLATNLYRLGVPEKTIQAILRHANVSTTQTCYIKTTSSDAKVAMEKLESLLASSRPVKSLNSDPTEFSPPVTIQ